MRLRFSGICLCFLLFFTACTANNAPSNVQTEEESVPQGSSEVEVSTEEAESTESDTPIARGAALFSEVRNGFACATCHYPSENRLLGPGLANITARFESYSLTVSVEEYLHESIVTPLEFIAPAEPPYPVNIMPQNYAELFTEEEISDLIAYILSL